MSSRTLASAQSLDFIPDNPAELRTAVTRMAAHINAVDWQFLKLIAAMDRSRGWREGGYCNLSNWLDHRCGMGTCAARERIRISRALVKLPGIDAAFRDGVISYSKVRAMTRVATPETDEMLLAIARQSSAAQLDSLVRTYERVGGKKRQPTEQQRSLSWHYEDGMLVVTAAVPAAQGALLIKALEDVVGTKTDEREAYYEALNTGNGSQRGAGSSEDESDRLGEASGGDVPAETADDTSMVPDDEPDFMAGLAFHYASREQRFADALIDVAEHYLAGSGQCQRRRPGQRYEVMLHIDRNQLAAQHQHNKTRFYVDPDWGIDEDEARQIACDADITEFIQNDFIQNEKGAFLDYQRRRRIVPTRLLRALKIRHDNRCSFPGCPHHRYLEAHHVRHWIDGGETNIDNLALLCSAHHRLLHHRAFHMAVQDDRIVFVSRHGEVIDKTLTPQFPDVSAEASFHLLEQPGHLPAKPGHLPAKPGHLPAKPGDLPAKPGDLPAKPGDLPAHPGDLPAQRGQAELAPARQPRKHAVFDSKTDRDVIDMLHFRERWGGKRRDRLWARILK